MAEGREIFISGISRLEGLFKGEVAVGFCHFHFWQELRKPVLVRNTDYSEKFRGAKAVFYQ